MKAVILAAGPGGRMRPLTNNCPKGLLQLNNESIIRRQIRILKNQGFEEKDIAIVIGYRADDFRKEFSNSDITLIENKKYSSTDNLYSFKLSRDFAEKENFLVINGDAIFSEGLIEKILNISSSGYPLDLDNADEESIKVKIEGDRIVRIMGKDAENFDGVTTEVFRIAAKDSEKIFDAADLISKKDRTQWFDSAVDEVLDDSYFKAVDVSDEFWDEVDTPEELKRVREKIQSI